jgi:hypothetical protein
VASWPNTLPDFSRHRISGSFGEGRAAAPSDSGFLQAHVVAATPFDIIQCSFELTVAQATILRAFYFETLSQTGLIEHVDVVTGAARIYRFHPSSPPPQFRHVGPRLERSGNRSEWWMTVDFVLEGLEPGTTSFPLTISLTTGAIAAAGFNISTAAPGGLILDTGAVGMTGSDVTARPVVVLDVGSVAITGNDVGTVAGEVTIDAYSVGGSTSVNSDPWATVNHTLGGDATALVAIVATTTNHTVAVQASGINMHAGPAVGPASGDGNGFTRSFYLLGAELPPAGTVGIVVNPSGVAARGSVGVWSLSGTSFTAFDDVRFDDGLTASGNSNATVLTNVPAGAAILGGFANIGSSSGATLVGEEIEHSNLDGVNGNGNQIFASTTNATPGATITYTYGHQANAASSALMIEVLPGSGGIPPPIGPLLDKLVAYYPAYDSGAMGAADIPWFVSPHASGLTHLMYFSAMPVIDAGAPTIDPDFFTPALNLAAVVASRAAAGSTAKILLVIGGANTNNAFKDCMTYRSGTAILTQGSVTVTGVGTSWTSALNGQVFSRTSTGIPYTVQTVNGATSLTLSSAYAEESAASPGVGYEIEWPAQLADFVTNVVTYLSANPDYAGIDVDWEAFPGGTEVGADRFDAFMRALHAAMIAVDPAYILASSSAGRLGPAFNTFYVPILKALLDDDVLAFQFFQFYGMAQPGFTDGNVWHHEALYHDASDHGTPVFAVGVDEALQRFLDAGFPAAKIIVGAHIGGRPWEGGVMDLTHPGEGAFQPCMRWTFPTTANRPGQGAEQLYRQIVAFTDGSILRDVASGNTPYWSRNSSGSANDRFLSFEDAQSAQAKITWLRDRCGGYGWWHMSSDYIASGGTVAQKHPVVAAIYAAMDAL